MEKHDRFDTVGDPQAYGRLLLLGLWMRAAFVGAAFALAGVASLFDPQHGVSISMALTWIAAGATFAWLAWQRTRAALDRIDTVDTPHPKSRDASPMRAVSRVPA